MSARTRSKEWWVRIAHAFRAHVREEAVFLEEYEVLAQRTDDPGTRFLVELVLDDERRHHELFERMAADIVADGTGALPDVPEPSADRVSELLSATDRFLDAEREDAQRLRELRRELRVTRDDALWHLLVELMELDTAKHVKILEYLRDRLRAVASSKGT